MKPPRDSLAGKLYPFTLDDFSPTAQRDLEWAWMDGGEIAVKTIKGNKAAKKEQRAMVRTDADRTFDEWWTADLQRSQEAAREKQARLMATPEGQESARLAAVYYTAREHQTAANAAYRASHPTGTKGRRGLGDPTLYKAAREADEHAANAERAYQEARRKSLAAAR